VAANVTNDDSKPAASSSGKPTQPAANDVWRRNQLNDGERNIIQRNQPGQATSLNDRQWPIANNM